MDIEALPERWKAEGPTPFRLLRHAELVLSWAKVYGVFSVCKPAAHYAWRAEAFTRTFEAAKRVADTMPEVAWIGTNDTDLMGGFVCTTLRMGTHCRINGPWE